MCRFWRLWLSVAAAYCISMVGSFQASWRGGRSWTSSRPSQRLDGPVSLVKMQHTDSFVLSRLATSLDAKVSSRPELDADASQTVTTTTTAAAANIAEDIEPSSLTSSPVSFTSVHIAQVHDSRDRSRRKEKERFSSRSAAVSTQEKKRRMTKFDQKRIDSLILLRIYKKLHGNLLVAQSFVVPQADDWPSEQWGMHLGYRVRTLRAMNKANLLGPDFKADLEALEFVWDVYDDKYSDHINALLKYREIYGHLNIRNSFVVPACEPWPSELWGLRLGRKHSEVRRGVLCPSRTYLDQMLQLGLIEEDEIFGDKNTDTRKKPQFARIVANDTIALLQQYQKIYGHCIVSTTFTIPDDPRWPRHRWGYKLGQKAYSIRKLHMQGRLHPRLYDAFSALDLNWNIRQKLRISQDDLISLLLRYKNKFGSFAVYRQFVVPSDSDDWPEVKCFGYQLGQRVCRIRMEYLLGTISPSLHQKLIDIGFTWQSNVPGPKPRSLKTFVFNATEVLGLLTHYREVYNDSYILQSYVIPKSKNWPMQYWGYRLGYGAHRAMLFRKRDIIDALTRQALSRFTVIDKSTAYGVVRLLGHYQKLYGDLQISNHYRIPCNKDWPRQYWDYNLGLSARRLRRLSRRGELDASLKRKLDALGFMWRIEKDSVSNSVAAADAAAATAAATIASVKARQSSHTKRRNDKLTLADSMLWSQDEWVSAINKLPTLTL